MAGKSTATAGKFATLRDSLDLAEQTLKLVMPTVTAADSSSR